MSDTRLSSRRRFLIQAAAAAAAVPLGARFLSGSAHAQAVLPRLPLDNPQAKALKYTEDASKVADPVFKPGSTCTNCQFHQAATGGCTLFAGFSVAPDGWCSAWAKKA